MILDTGEADKRQNRVLANQQTVTPQYTAGCAEEVDSPSSNFILKIEVSAVITSGGWETL